MTKTIAAENGNLTIIYNLTERTEEGVTLYGISAKVKENGEEAVVPDISPNRPLVESLLRAVSDGEVTPVTLFDVVYDFISEI